MKTKLIPAIAISLMGFFASASFAQEDVAPAVDQPVVAEEVAGEVSEAAVEKAEKAAAKAEKTVANEERKAAKEEKKGNKGKGHNK